jgi:hypothetical protein
MLSLKQLLRSLHSFEGLSTIWAICVVAVALPFGQSGAAETVLGSEAAKGIQIVDAHFHVLPWMDIQELLRHMDHSGIRWAGGVGGGKHAEAVIAMGSRYIRPTGMGYWLSLHRKLKVAAFEDPDTPAMRESLSSIEADLRDRGARAIGEIHVNALTSTTEPAYRFKLRGDSPILKALLALAAKYTRALNIHAQWDPDTAQEVERLAATNRSARLILAHCGSFATPSEIRGAFERNINLSCDLSARGVPPLKRKTSAVFDEQGIIGDWRRLIEDYSDRFVIGIDTVQNWGEYESVLHSIRFGLLASLSPEAAEKVAHKNAEAWFGLE